MAQIYWKGGQSAVAMVRSATPANVEINDIFTLTVTADGGTATAAISFTATAGTVANVTAGLAAAWNASTDPLITPITASDQTTFLRLTADTAGVPFVVAGSTTNAGGGANTQTLTMATTTANVGPNDWNTALNWSGGAVPVNSDDVTIDGRGASNAILYGLDQSAVTLASLRHYQSMTAAIGSSTSALKISATIAQTNLPVTDGRSVTPGFLNIDFGSTATTYENFGGGNGSGGLPGVTIAGSNASNKFTSHAGNVGIGLMTPNATCTFPTIDTRGGSLTTGTGTDFTTCTNNGATVILYKGSSSGTLNNLAGTTTVEGATKIGTVTCAGGSVKYNVRISGDDIDTLNLDGGDIDFTGDTTAFTVNALAIKRGGNVRVFNSSQATFTTTTIDDNYGVQFRVQIG